MAHCRKKPISKAYYLVVLVQINVKWIGSLIEYLENKTDAFNAILNIVQKQYLRANWWPLWEYLDDTSKMSVGHREIFTYKQLGQLPHRSPELTHQLHLCASDSLATYGAIEMCFDWLIDWLIAHNELIT